MEDKYNIEDKVKTKKHYQNDKSKELEAIVRDIESKKKLISDVKSYLNQKKR